MAKRAKFTGQAVTPEAKKKKAAPGENSDCGTLGDLSHVNMNAMSTMQTLLDRMHADPFF